MRTCINLACTVTQLAVAIQFLQIINGNYAQKLGVTHLLNILNGLTSVGDSNSFPCIFLLWFVLEAVLFALTIVLPSEHFQLLPENGFSISESHDQSPSANCPFLTPSITPVDLSSIARDSTPTFTTYICLEWPSASLHVSAPVMIIFLRRMICCAFLGGFALVFAALLAEPVDLGYVIMMPRQRHPLL
ncbi:hypothetical protein TSMEX_000368 [Taenia solium]|eukprot:TsM_000406800 transcript=TsM_000406800 gene=TsM_000406800